MRHRKRTEKLGRTSSHREAMLANMVSSLITEKRIRTTLAKAKVARRVADRCVTLAKKGNLRGEGSHSPERRLVTSRLRQTDAVQELFDVVAPAFVDRNGGYTRITKIGKRSSDSSEMCFLEWVDMPVAPKAAPVEAAADSE